MRNISFTIILLFAVVVSVHAGTARDSISQPTSVIARKLDNSGNVLSELHSEFSYDTEGKLYDYTFPSHSIVTFYTYSGDFMEKEATWHNTNPINGEVFNYTYENGLVKTVSQLFDHMEPNRFWDYNYDDQGRLLQIDFGTGYSLNPNAYHEHWAYQYETDGNTKTETYYTDYANNYLLKEISAYHYDENYQLIDIHTDIYNNGEISKSTLQTYSYTPGGKVSTVTDQTLNDGQWVNTALTTYLYDSQQRVIDYYYAIWDNSFTNWRQNKRITYEFDDQNQTLTVSFLKMADDYTWIWDTFSGQTVFYEPELKWQQKALRFHYLDVMFSGSEQINQFEITLQNTVRPIYLETKEESLTLVEVYPNPTNGSVRIDGVDAAQVEVYNSMGQLVKTFHNSNELHLEGLAKGLYLLRITDKNGETTTTALVRK